MSENFKLSLKTLCYHLKLYVVHNNFISCLKTFMSKNFMRRREKVEGES